MSGIEIAGLVLGALPLIFSAIEHYKSGLDGPMAFFRWAGLLEKAVEELWIQYTYYEITLKTLLKDIKTTSELEEMMSAPDSPLWKDQDLEAELKIRLGNAYGVFVHTTKQIESQLESLAKSLNIDKRYTTANELEAVILANQALRKDVLGAPKFEFTRRIRFTMKRTQINKLVKGIKECNKRLDDFIKKAEMMEEPPSMTVKESTRARMSTPLWQIQVYAEQLYKVLSRAWSTCTHLSHNANLMLEHRMIRKKQSSRISQGGDLTFTVLLKGPVAKMKWTKAEVRVPKEALSQSKPEHRPFHSANGGRLPNPRAEARVLSGEYGSISDLDVIYDLCELVDMRNNHPDPCCYGLWLGSQGELRGPDPSINGPTLESDGFVTLDELLFPPDFAIRQSLTEEKRYVLAITLASSFLQLHRTPWLGEWWDKSYVRFKKISSPGTNRLGVDVENPFIAKTYNAPNSASPQVSTIYDVSESLSHRNHENLLALAMILLEIRLSRHIEDALRKEYLGPGGLPNEATNLQLLQKWVWEQEGNLSFAFKDAISFCMRCFADPFTNLADDTCRSAIVNNVVVPLMDELFLWKYGPQFG